MFRKVLVTIVFAVVCMLVSACGQVAAQTEAGSKDQEAVVRGESVIKKAPDKATLHLTLEAKASNADAAHAKVLKSETELQKAVAKIAGVKMTTSQYSVGDNYEYSQGRQTRDGFKSTMSIALEINDISKLTEVLALGEISGVSELTGLRFDVKDRKSVHLEAIKQAVQDGLKKANAMASGSGKSGADLLRLQEENVEFSDPFSLRSVVIARGFYTEHYAAAIAAGAAGNEPFIIPADVEVKASVVLLTKLR